MSHIFRYVGLMSIRSMVSQSKIGPMMTIGEVAQFLSVHVNTVRRWSNRGLLNPYHIGKRRDRRFLREDVTRFLNGLNKNNGDERKAQLSRW